MVWNKLQGLNNGKNKVRRLKMVSNKLSRLIPVCSVVLLFFYTEHYRA